MSAIVCPRCAHSAPVSKPIQDADFEWACPSCRKTFEIRTVFIERTPRVDKDEFRERVRRELERQQVTQSQLGRLVGVSGAYISTVLSGRREVSQDLAERLSRALRTELR